MLIQLNQIIQKSKKTKNKNKNVFFNRITNKRSLKNNNPNTVYKQNAHYSICLEHTTIHVTTTK